MSHEVIEERAQAPGARVAHRLGSAKLRKFFIGERAKEVFRETGPLIEPNAMMHPLLELSAGDFGSGGVFHEVVNRHSTLAI